MAKSTSKWSGAGDKPGNGPKIETKEDCYDSCNHEPVKGNVCDNDKGNHLSACLKTDAKYGQVTLNKDGSFCYIPKKDFCGWDEFFYEVKDKFGKTCIEKCKIFVKADDKPDAINDNYCVDECQTICFDVLANDKGKDLTVIKWDVKGLDKDAGKLTLLKNGQFKFEAYKDSDCDDECVEICYTVKDCNGCTDTATAKISVKDLYQNTPLVG
jgi:hypothetical protein